MRRDDGRPGRGQRVVERLVGDVGNVHHHAQTVHPFHHCAPEIRQAVPLRLVTRRVRPLGVLGVRQRHVADAQAIENIERAQVVLDDVAAFDSHQDRDLLLAVDARDVVRRERQIEGVRMAGHLLVHQVNQVERAMDQVLGGPIDADPDREELRPKMPVAHLRDADHIGAAPIGQVVALVEHHLGSVGVRVDDDDALEHAVGDALGLGIRPFLRGRESENANREDQQPDR